MNYDIKVSAPGKLFLSGEYAVLEGAPAVIDSVNRRVFAVPCGQNIPQSMLIKQAKTHVADFLCTRAGRPIGQLPNIEIDSKGFTIDKRKLGIGSSAAVAAATTGALFEWAGLSIEKYRPQILAVATNAHRAYQNGKGSGADVATSVMGGTILFSIDGSMDNAPPNPLHKIFIWTGKSASTVSLVEEVKKLQQTNNSQYQSIMATLCSLATSLAEHYRNANVTQIISATKEYELALATLGKMAQISIVTSKMHQISALAKQCNGAAKPSGAGGGDACVALFALKEDAERFTSQIDQTNCEILDFRTCVPGLRKE